MSKNTIIIVLLAITAGFVVGVSVKTNNTANTDKSSAKSRVSNEVKYSFKGEGKQTVGPIRLGKGLAVVHAKNLTGSNDNFTLEVLKDENGDGKISSGEGYTGVNINVAYKQAETYNGEIALKANDADYFINVDGGRWEINITQPEKLEKPANAPVKYEGEGDTVTEKFFLKEGVVKFRATHKGNSVFSVYVSDQNGNSSRYLVNDLGEVDTDFEYKNVFEDNYVFVVRASGPWSIEPK